MKISVIGTGKVGGATAFALVTRGVPHELVLVGRDRDKALGDAYDLLHASAFIRPMDVKAGGVPETRGSDIVVIAVSARADVAGDRLSNAEANARLVAELVPGLAEASPGAIFVVLTNPVDVCTYVALRASGRPAGQVLGTGTLIDTGRFRALLSRETGINATDIRAYILGEHGETQFPALSVAAAGGVRFVEGDETVKAMFEEARRGGHDVMRYKGYTNYAVAMSASLVCEAIAGNTHAVMPVSTLVDGYKGVRDVCLSLPCVVGRAGVERVLAIDLNEPETAQFHHSADVLRGILDQVIPVAFPQANPGEETR